jgi:hypothetical protein
VEQEKIKEIGKKAFEKTLHSVILKETRLSKLQK